MNEHQDNREAFSTEENELFQYDMPEQKQKKTKNRVIRSSLLRKFMPIFVLLVSAAVLLTAYFVLRSINPEDNGEDEVNMIKVVSENTTDVKSIKVKNKNDAYTMYKKSGSVYKIEGYEDKPVSADVISTSIGYLTDIQSAKRVMVANDKLKDYGLAKPVATVEITTTTKEITLYLGNQSAGDDFYFMLGNDPENTAEKTAVYLMSDIQANVCTADRFYYYDGDLSKYNASDDNGKITAVSIGGSKGTKADVYMSNEELSLTYMMADPVNMPFASTVMDGILSLLTTMNSAIPVSDDVSDANLAKLGLKEPSYTLSWVNNTIERTVVFGNEVDGYIYCTAEDAPAIYQIPSGAVAILGMDIADMCDIITYTRDVDTLNRIVVTSGKKTYDIQTEGTGDQRVVTINNKTVESSIFSEFYSTLLGIEVQREGEKPAGKEPLLTMEITLAENGEKEILSYYEVDERYCFYEMNGKGMFYVKTQDVQNILVNAQKVYDNQEIHVVW